MRASFIHRLAASASPHLHNNCGRRQDGELLAWLADSDERSKCRKLIGDRLFEPNVAAAPKWVLKWVFLQTKSGGVAGS